MCQVIEEGILDSDAGNTRDVKEIRAKYKLSERKSYGQRMQKNILMQFMITLPGIPLSMPIAWRIA
ncbi:MAG: hypothetical protein SVR08_16815 [Spirochaetota bacterium]|nr:hypothetical protein [Spirochaetota bacterium]